MIRRTIPGSLVLAVACGLLVFACSTSCSSASSSARASSIESLTADASSGQSLYASNCASCHGSNGASGSANKNVASVAKNQPTTAIDQILGGGDGMASFSSLSDQEIADIVGYLKTL